MRIKLDEMIRRALSSLGINEPVKNEIDDSEMKKKIEETYEQGYYVKDKLPELEDLELERIEYDAKSDDEIKSEAQNLLKEYEASSQSAIEKEAKDSELNLLKYKEDLDANKAKQQDYVEAVATQRAENASNNALKRGLARSSIVINNLMQIDKEKAEEMIAVNEQYLKDIADTDYKIADLQTQKEVALKNLEATLATKLQMKITELTNERDKKVEDAIKYNNSIAEKVADYNLEKSKAELDIENKATDLLKKQINYENTYEYNTKVSEERYQIIREYLLSLDKRQARELLLNDPFYKSSLNEYYYRLLSEEFDRW